MKVAIDVRGAGLHCNQSLDGDGDGWVHAPGDTMGYRPFPADDSAYRPTYGVSVVFPTP